MDWRGADKMSCRLSLAISVGRVMGGAPSFEYKTSLKTPKNRVDDDFDILFEKEHLHW